jgi:hypothetical protein
MQGHRWAGNRKQRTTKGTAERRISRAEETMYKKGRTSGCCTKLTTTFEKPAVAQPLKKFRAFCETQRFIIVITRAHY